MHCYGPFVAEAFKFDEVDAHNQMIASDCEIIVKYPIPLLLEHNLNQVGEVIAGFRKDNIYYVIFTSNICFDENYRLSVGGEGIIDDNNVIRKLFIYEVSLTKRPAQNVSDINNVLDGVKKSKNISIFYTMADVKKQQVELEALVETLSKDLTALAERVALIENTIKSHEQKVEEILARLAEVESKLSAAAQASESLEEVTKSVSELVSDLVPVVKQLLKQ